MAAAKVYTGNFHMALMPGANRFHAQRGLSLCALGMLLDTRMAVTLDMFKSWLSAHISNTVAAGKPLVVEVFGKAKAATKVYTGDFPHVIVLGAHLPLSQRCH